MSYRNPNAITSSTAEAALLRRAEPEAAPVVPKKAAKKKAAKKKAAKKKAKRK